MRWSEARDLVPVLARGDVLLHHIRCLNAERSLIQAAGVCSTRVLFLVVQLIL